MSPMSSSFVMMLLVLGVGVACLPTNAFGQAEDSAYVTIRDGHITLSGERVRFWGCVGTFPGANYADNEAVVQRIKALGFNMVRYWPGFFEPTDYEKGDLSRADLVDHFLWCLKKEGMRAWCAGLNQVGRATPADVGVLDDPATAEAWAEAVGPDGVRVRNYAARIWDPRIEALGLARMKQVADHVNHHTGFRWADDPVFAVWELSNEEWWFGRVVGDYAFWSTEGAGFVKMPEFFQKELIEQWNAFLKAKYADEDELRAAWLGLLPGESLQKGTILLLPLRSPVPADTQRRILGLEPEAGVDRLYSPDDFNAARGGDVVEFLVGIWVNHKQKEADAVKSWGKSTRLCPLVWDTGVGFDRPSQFLHQHADAVTHCVYLRGFTHDPTARRYPWYSGLEQTPRLCWDEPAVEHNRMAGKPFFVYENQMEQPAKYRAEYPMRVAALGAIQDWDIVVWHYFGHVPDSTKAKPYEHAMDYSTSDEWHPQGLHFQYDEVQMAAMVAAADIFKQGLLGPAPNPTTVIFGRKSLYNMAKTRYGQAGRILCGTPYRYGLRLLIDPEREDDEIVGPVVKDRDHLLNPVRPTDEIEYDWQRGHLLFDAPAVAMYSGFFAQYGGPVRFGNGVTLKDVHIENPPDVPYPDGPDAKYVTFSLVSTDPKARSLAEARSAILSAVSTSFNSGFKLDHTKLVKPLLWPWNPGATVSTGGLPVLVTRVGATVEAPMLKGMRYRFLDFHLNEVGSGMLEEGVLTIPADVPVFLVVLER